MDASPTGRLEWCTAVCSLVLIAISLFFFIFVNVVLSHRWVWCAAYGCSNAYYKRKPGVGFFSVSETADSVSREVECLLMALASCSLDDQYVQYSTKRGLHCGLRTPQLFGLGKGV